MACTASRGDSQKKHRKPHRTSPPASPAPKNEGAVSTLIGTILIIFLVVILSASITMSISGMIGLQQKSAYLTADAQYRIQSGVPVVTLLHTGGESLPLSGPGNTTTANTIRIISGSNSTIAQPDSSGIVWKPGMILYIARSGDGYLLTSDPGRIAASNLTFPAGAIEISIVDSSANSQIFRTVLTIPGIPVTTSLTPTPSPSATSVSTRTVTVIWSPDASGYGSESPPARLANSQEVKVPRGSSKTIYYVPNANVAVLNIKLDGTTVYTGSSLGTTISYTITNILEDRTLIATFG